THSSAAGPGAAAMMPASRRAPSSARRTGAFIILPPREQLEWFAGHSNIGRCRGPRRGHAENKGVAVDPEQFSTLEQPRFEFAMEVRLRFTRVQQITEIPTGGIRSAVYVDSGEFSGPKLKGKAVPNSGGDYALFRPDDVADYDARYMLDKDD